MVRELLDIEIAEISLTAFPGVSRDRCQRRAAVAAGGQDAGLPGHLASLDSPAPTGMAGAMTDDELRELTNTLIVELAPVREVTERVLTLVEDLVRRVEVLELERLHGRAQKCTPNAPSESDTDPKPEELNRLTS